MSADEAARIALAYYERECGHPRDDEWVVTGTEHWSAMGLWFVAFCNRRYLETENFLFMMGGPRGVAVRESDGTARLVRQQGSLEDALHATGLAR